MARVLWGFALVVLAIWVAAFLFFREAGAVIHLLLVLAAAIIVWNVVSGRRTVS